MKRILIKNSVVLLVIASLLSACNANKQGVGTGIGLVAGGLIGSQFGKGGFSTVLGAGIGALIGGAIGQKMDEKDKKLAAEATQRTLEAAPTGSTVAWQNPDNGHNGKITLTKTYPDQGRHCREYTHVVEIGGEFQRAYGKACRTPDGQWEIVSNN
ncbi:17 kD surface antigen [Candidatus Phycorickettsia trachydisci]|uniref:17 kDa surface antigen n=1 Tax=Candidatus Phycorickettsia trachydisci TaxID=2115978 RepID=A0A2P1P6U4_9RICK|nr:RT0821/Lpp0805 family surface protein [Candidatus Phycorickettsia trachydisci]AVP86993.1 17 kD surface antigen [Candidatus Phycorickettsia trachydisci]